MQRRREAGRGCAAERGGGLSCSVDVCASGSGFDLLAVLLSGLLGIEVPYFSASASYCPSLFPYP